MTVRSVCLLLALAASSLRAHQPDTSQLVVRIGESAIDAEFSADIATLQRIAPALDANRDGALSREEAESGRNVIESYLRQHLFLDVDGRESGWGDARPPRWPLPGLEPIPAAEWRQLLLCYPFRLPLQQAPAGIRVTCDVFIELGLSHRIIGEFQPGDRIRHPVVFTLEEPDYHFDIRRALASAPTGQAPSPPLPRPARSEAFRNGMASMPKPVTLLLLLVLLAGAPPRRVFAVTAAFLAGQLAMAIPVTLWGPPLPARWWQLLQSLAVPVAALLNLWRPPRMGSNPRPLAIAFGFGLIQGLASGALVREMCLHPLTPVACLVPFQAGANVALLCAAGFLISSLTVAGAWRAGTLLPRVVSAAALVCGLWWVLQSFR